MFDYTTGIITVQYFVQKLFLTKTVQFVRDF